MNEQLPLEVYDSGPGSGVRFQLFLALLVILTPDLDPGFDDPNLPMDPDPPLYLVLPMD